jgi:membrane AbrB-like protein
MTRRTLITFAIGALGALLAQLVGLPAGALLGASLATSAAAWAKVELHVPNVLREAAILVIGVALGSGVDPDVLHHLHRWATSLALLAVSITTTVYGSSWILRRFWKFDRNTAFLSSVPGTFSMVMALVAEGRGRPSTVLVMQTMRLLSLTAIVPLAVALLGIDAANGTGQPVGSLSLPVFLALMVPGAALSLLLRRVRFPAAFLVGAMLVSAMAHATGVVEGRPPMWILVAGFTVTGAALGSRFTGIGLSEVLRALGATAAAVGSAAVISAGFAALTGALTGLPYGQIWIAFAPGGVEAMSAIGLALNFDPAYVATHHLFRIFVLILLLSWAMRRAG